MKLILSLALILGSTPSFAAILTGDPGCQPGINECMFFTTSSIPTMIIANEVVDYNSAEGKALLIQEATNILDGKKSLIIKDDAAGSQNGLTAIQKAQIILENSK